MTNTTMYLENLHRMRRRLSTTFYALCLKTLEQFSLEKKRRAAEPRSWLAA